MFFRKRRRRAIEDVQGRLGAHRLVLIDESANCFGIGSKGAAQIRGNGCLGTSDQHLMFVMWLPRKEILIPRAQITSVERTTSHLGKTVGRELLLVRFTDDAGRPDSVAWLVADLGAWLSALSI